MEIDSLLYISVIMYLRIHYVLFVYVRMCIYINFLITMTKHLTYTSYRMELTLAPTVRGCSSSSWTEQLTPVGWGPRECSEKALCESHTMVPRKTWKKCFFCKPSPFPPLFQPGPQPQQGFYAH